MKYITIIDGILEVGIYKDLVTLITLSKRFHSAKIINHDIFVRQKMTEKELLYL